MSGDREDRRGRAVRRPRVVRRPVAGPGPLGELKELLYRLYLEAGPPTLEHIAALIAADEGLDGMPEKDTIARCLGSPDLPASQLDVIAIATVLAREARWDPDDAVARARALWVQARMSVPAGRPVGEFTDPFALEVHQPVEVAVRPGAAELPVLPAYVPREHDRRLAGVVSRAAGGDSLIAVLVGGSSTGKTRACWEAVHALPAGWRLWHPIFPDRAEAFLAELERVGPRTVVWLNETQFYLLTGDPLAGERVAAGLRDLLRDPARGPVLVLGTIWPRYWQPLTAPPTPDGRDPHAHARELLVGAGIEVPDTFTGPALEALAAAARDDPRLAAAQKAGDGQVTQFLAGVPVLLERYRTAPSVARAVIDAALDARALGHGPALPHALLEAAATGYLTDQQWEEDAGEDWLDQALAYTAAPCRGVRGPLTRIRPRLGQPTFSQPHYRLADYLEQIGRADRRAGLRAGFAAGRPARARQAGRPRAARRPGTGPGAVPVRIPALCGRRRGRRHQRPARGGHAAGGRGAGRGGDHLAAIARRSRRHQRPARGGHAAGEGGAGRGGDHLLPAGGRSRRHQRPARGGHAAGEGGAGRGGDHLLPAGGRGRRHQRPARGGHAAGEGGAGRGGDHLAAIARRSRRHQRPARGGHAAGEGGAGRGGDHLLPAGGRSRRHQRPVDGGHAAGEGGAGRGGDHLLPAGGRGPRHQRPVDGCPDT